MPLTQAEEDRGAGLTQSGLAGGVIYTVQRKAVCPFKILIFHLGKALLYNDQINHL